MVVVVWFCQMLGWEDCLQNDV